MSAGIVLEGADRLLAAFRSARENADQVVVDELVRSSKNIVAGARRRFRIRTGRLRRSIRYRLDADRLGSSIGPTEWYGRLVHNGTRRSRANPFLFDAFEEEVPEFQRRLRESLAVNVFARMKA